ncbi:hypothetical protein GALMADRAFT_1364046 [Galerina marginata CBS 339.88]|uniref:Uncharacterized protein n=1 Tax=Galerina marginata (strain CBS 339.88) TaxID=685588 RepID=A0A067T8Q4_GALM3|nr:hypothetical protein GALMADRAFT_1364046 [Galerina marginata CBS 339.88]
MLNMVGNALPIGWHLTTAEATSRTAVEKYYGKHMICGGLARGGGQTAGIATKPGDITFTEDYADFFYVLPRSFASVTLSPSPSSPFSAAKTVITSRIIMSPSISLHHLSVGGGTGSPDLGAGLTARHYRGRFGKQSAFILAFIKILFVGLLVLVSALTLSLGTSHLVGIIRFGGGAAHWVFWGFICKVASLLSLATAHGMSLTATPWFSG